MKEEEESPTTTTTTKPSNVDDTESEPDLERQAMDKYTMHAGRRECRICLSQDDESEWVQVRIGIEETARWRTKSHTALHAFASPVSAPARSAGRTSSVSGVG